MKNLKQVSLLSICQSLMTSCNTLIVASSPLVGLQIATNKALAALPLAVLLLAGMFMSIPAAFLLQKFGRKKGFMTATSLGISGGFFSFLGIYQTNFWIFILGIMLVGMFNGFGNYYRMLAADIVDINHKSKAIAFVILGGVFAAIIGPNIASYTKDISTAPFAYSYGSIIILHMLSFIFLSFLKIPEHMIGDEVDVNHNIERNLKKIIVQPNFILAILSAAIGYAVMAFIMTASPLAMDHYKHSFSSTSFVIQWHVMAMYAPSLFTGSIINYLGVRKVIFIGVMLGFISIIINLKGISFLNFWWSMFLLGISWNFMFVGGSTLLSSTYHNLERAKVQAFNDFVVFSSAGLFSLLAGIIHFKFSWQIINITAIPMLIIALIALILTKK